MFVVGWLAIDKMTNYLPFLSSARISLYVLLVLGVCGVVVNVYCLVAIFIKRTIPNYVSVGILSALVLRSCRASERQQQEEEQQKSARIWRDQ